MSAYPRPHESEAFVRPPKSKTAPGEGPFREGDYGEVVRDCYRRTAAGLSPSNGGNDGAKRGSEAVPLFLPVVGVVVVAVALPEAGLVGRPQLEPAQPLRALPEVPRRHHQAEGPAVLGRERLAVGLVRDQRVVVLDRLERQVRREALLRVRGHEAGARLRAHELRDLAPVDASEARVEPAPARDAVDVHGHRAARQLLQLLPGQRQRLLDLAEDAEVPRAEVGVGNRPCVQHGPLLRQVLARWQPRRIEAALDELLLRLRPKQRLPTAPCYAERTGRLANGRSRGSRNPR